MKKILAIFIPFLVITGLFAALAFLIRREPPHRVTQDETPVTPAVDGMISGSLSYPGEFIPALEICAERTDTGEQYCTYKMIQGPAYSYGYGYDLQVPPGMYKVYARVNTLFETYRAYYSKFITCGGEYTCTDHAPITVQVQPGETVRNIDPGDWYAPT